MHLYMQEAGEHRLLSREEEQQLFEDMQEFVLNPKTRSKKIKNRWEKARETLIRSNLKLVIKIANRYRNIGLDFADLINEGNIGLMNAVDKFDPRKGAKLSYYASFWIKQCIRRAISNKGRTIRLPVATVEAKLKIHKCIDKFELRNYREPTEDEIAEETSLPIKKVKELLSLDFQSESLNTKIGEDSEELGNLLKNKDAPSPFALFSNKDEHQVLNSFLERLEFRQKYIIIHRFGLNGTRPQTLETIGQKFDLTRERIRQLELVALKTLKEMYKKINKNKVMD